MAKRNYLRPLKGDQKRTSWRAISTAPKGSTFTVQCKTGMGTEVIVRGVYVIDIAGVKAIRDRHNLITPYLIPLKWRYE